MDPTTGGQEEGLSPSEARAECVRQLLPCSPAPGNASDGAYRTDTHVLTAGTSNT